MKPLLLVFCVLGDDHRAQISRHYELRYAPKPADAAAQLAACDPRARVVLTTGSIGLSEQAIDALPCLELVCALGVGYENIALPRLRERGIVLANGAGTNADSVADHAMGLLLAAVRKLAWLDAQVRRGLWRDDIPMPADVSGRRLGLLGLGDIGRGIARRAAAFNLPIGYCARRPREDVDYAYFPTARDLARWCDFLVVATPGGPDTRHLVDAPVLEALGPDGVLVNIARGTVVDTRALADALRAGRLAAAGLDVYEDEPLPPGVLLDLPGVILTPHVGGSSPSAVQNSVDRFLDNAAGHFAGRGPVSPVP